MNGFAGLVFDTNSTGSSLRGLSIFNSTGSAIDLETDNVTVAGNFLGIEADGTTLAGNAIGVNVGRAVTLATIGTTALADRNLISGNKAYGHRARRARACSSMGT